MLEKEPIKAVLSIVGYTLTGLKDVGGLLVTKYEYTLVAPKGHSILEILKCVGLSALVLFNTAFCNVKMKQR